MLPKLERWGRFPWSPLKCTTHARRAHRQTCVVQKKDRWAAPVGCGFWELCSALGKHPQPVPRVRRLRTSTVSIGKSWVTCCLRYVNNTKKLNGTDDMWVVSFRVCVWCALAPKNLLAPQANATGQHNLFVINRRQEPTQSALWRQRFN